MRIYVGNLSYRTTEEELRALFEAYGDVAEVRVITDRETGRSRGFAFVEMANEAEARAAIEGLNEKEHMGRALRINEAQPRKDGGGGGRRERRPRRGGGGGGGGGYGKDGW
jgi:RNA recognition motif-containing protein